MALAADGSVVLRVLDRNLPLSHLLATPVRCVGGLDVGLPRYVDVFSAEEIVDVRSAAARTSSTSPAWCDDIVDRSGAFSPTTPAITGSEGTGFLIAPEPGDDRQPT